MSRVKGLWVPALLAFLAGVMGCAAGRTELIPREVLFGNPDRVALQLSPDGAHLAYVAPLDGVLNVWVAPAENVKKAAPVTRDTGRGITQYFWTFTNDRIVYLQDRDGDENWRACSVDIDSGQVTELSPLDGVQARIQEVSPQHPESILIALNDRTPQFHDLYRVHLTTGARELVHENTGHLAYITDDDYEVRYALRTTPDGGTELFKRNGDRWDDFLRFSGEDALSSGPAGLDARGERLYVLDSRGRNTAALTVFDTATNAQQILAENERCDVSDVLRHPTTYVPQAVAFTYLRKKWELLDPALKEDFAYLRGLRDADFEITSRSRADDKWIVAYLEDDGPTRYYLYDRPAGKARYLFTNRADLEGRPLVSMHPVVIPARDGLELVSYLSLPPESDGDGDARPDAPVPLVLFVHGGPWARDNWGYNPYHQWLANRGYAVLSVNFRGSTGLGKRLLNAGNKEWGGKMHDDLIDAVDWAVEQGVAVPDKVAIFGGSYGGYAVLWGLTNTPETFACGVDIVGPSSLVTLLESIPPYWAPMIDLFTTRVGDHRTEAGRAFLLARSPLTHMGNIRRPLLIGQGANDPRVKQAESDRIVQALQSKSIPVTYVLFANEGHGFARPENRLAFNAVAEAFLSEHLGGRYEPTGDAIAASSAKILAGAGEVPGLPAAGDAAANPAVDGQATK